jgi:hypothetical protein
MVAMEEDPDEPPGGSPETSIEGTPPSQQCKKEENGIKGPQKQAEINKAWTGAPARGRKRPRRTITAPQHQGPGRVQKGRKNLLAGPPTREPGLKENPELGHNDPEETKVWPEPAHPPLRLRNHWGVIKANTPTAT